MCKRDPHLSYAKKKRSQSTTLMIRSCCSSFRENATMSQQWNWEGPLLCWNTLRLPARPGFPQICQRHRERQHHQEAEHPEEAQGDQILVSASGQHWRGQHAGWMDLHRLSVLLQQRRQAVPRLLQPQVPDQRTGHPHSPQAGQLWSPAAAALFEHHRAETAPATSLSSVRPTSQPPGGEDPHGDASAAGAGASAHAATRRSSAAPPPPCQLRWHGLQ